MKDMTANLLITDNIPARDLVHRRLRDAIISGQFEPGKRLLERELVDQMGVSRTPIREALRKLELEGLVTTVPYKGPIVAMPTVEEARQLYEVRASLERRAVELFMERTDDGHHRAARQKALRQGARASARAEKSERHLGREQRFP